ncbi:MAG: class I SAM-dependent methyltransferase [Burkholderiales bacterium]|nr:class I SAM-dependent methyltransferase [Burkholderiales bacterium]
MRPPVPREKLSTLPQPDADALAHSAALTANIRNAIEAAGGWIGFDRFMDLALYAPGLGYYTAGARKFGPAGDFVTAPEISPLFGRCLARQIAEVLKQTGGSVLELGPGSGKLAEDILAELAALRVLPDEYLLLEVSADLRERQRERLSTHGEYSRMRWLDELPADFTGVILANEVLDVLPVHLVTYVEGWAFERGVALDAEGAFMWKDKLVESGPLVTLAPAIASKHLAGQPPMGYLTEISPQCAAWTRTLVQSLKRGAILLVDYGFRAAEYYHPSRTGGTLMCHYRHHAHPDPFFHPGLQDITAHVDFTAVADAGIEAGAEVLGYTTQAGFLLASGLATLLQEVDASDPARYLPITTQAQRLISPAEMGEFFKVLGLGKGVAAPSGFSARALAL